MISAVLRPITTFVIASVSLSIAQAGLVVRIDDVNIVAGQGGIVNVYLSSDGVDPITDFSFEFRITPVDGNPRQMLFADPQSDSQLFDSSYVFDRASLKRDGDPSLGITPSPVGDISTTLRPQDTFLGFDSDPTLLGASVGASELLLARLDLGPAVGLLAPIEGDQFQIEMVTGAGSGSFFLDLNSATDLIVPFTSTSGTITVTAVPEPTSLWFAVSGLIAIAYRRVRSTNRDSIHGNP